MSARSANAPARDISVAIVAPVYNRRETTLQCLRSLARVQHDGIGIRIIIVDDGSSDGTSEAIACEFPAVEVVRADGSLHYTRGTNRAIEAALEYAPDYVLAINDDSIFHEQFLQHLIACAEQNPRSVVGPVLLLWDEPQRVNQIDPKWQVAYGGWRLSTQHNAWDLPDAPFDVDMIVGNCVLYPAAAIRAVGFMNGVAFPFGFGDVEYTPRMKRAGWRLLIEPSALVWYEPNTVPASPGSLSIGSLMRILFRDQRSVYNLKRQFLIRWMSAPNPFSAVAAFVVFLIRMSLKAVGLAGRWPNWPDLPIGPGRES